MSFMSEVGRVSHLLNESTKGCLPSSDKESRRVEVSGPKSKGLDWSNMRRGQILSAVLKIKEDPGTEPRRRGSSPGSGLRT